MSAWFILGLTPCASLGRIANREVVFFGLGFETKEPSTAITALNAEAEGIKNFSLFCNHITIIPTMRAILESPDRELDGFLGPVS